jgi:hypothetical protein
MILTKSCSFLTDFEQFINCIICIYHLIIPVKIVRSQSLQITSCNFKLLLNHKKFAKTQWTKKLRLLHSFPMPYYLHYSDEWLENSAQITVRHFLVDPKYRIFNITQKPYRIWKNLHRYESCAFFIAFQRYIICTIPISGLETKSKIRFIRVYEYFRFLKLNLNGW